MQVVYPAVGIESYDTVKTKSLATYAISPARHQEEVERFLNDNYPNYSSKYYHDIPFDRRFSITVEDAIKRELEEEAHSVRGGSTSRT